MTYRNATLTVNPGPVVLTATDAVMTYGDKVPALAYTTEGFDLVGTPTISTAATSTSPVGTYDITIGSGTVQNVGATYVAGTLTIRPAELIVAAIDCERMEHQENPAFELAYTGFRNGETAATALSAQPTATCDATADSAPGEYAIVVSGAEAANYTIIYKSGTLTVTADTHVNIADADATRGADIYDVTGKLVRRAATSLAGLPRGIYIVGGRKVVVR